MCASIQTPQTNNKPKYYTFDGRRQAVEDGEKFLDEFFRQSIIVHTTKEGGVDDKRGIDRVFEDKETGREYTIQYKVDLLAKNTGNVCLELLSKDSDGSPGWLYTTEADYIIYYVNERGPAYMLTPQMLLKKVTEWIAKYKRIVAVRNKDYNTIVALIPQHEFERVSVKVYPM